MVDKEHLVVLLELELDLPAGGQRRERVGEHVEEAHELLVVLVAFEGIERVGAHTLHYEHQTRRVLEDLLGRLVGAHHVRQIGTQKKPYRRLTHDRIVAGSGSGGSWRVLY